MVMLLLQNVLCHSLNILMIALMLYSVCIKFEVVNSEMCVLCYLIKIEDASGTRGLSPCCEKNNNWNLLSKTLQLSTYEVLLIDYYM